MPTLPRIPITQITATGVSAPPFSAVLAAVQGIPLAIYGPDLYIDPDSQDGQFLAAFAQGVSDVNAALIDAYNSRSPSTAQGAGLTSIVKCNGISRKVATNSVAPVQLGGTAGTLVAAGSTLQDTQGNAWMVGPATIPSSGSILVQAVAVNSGSINPPSGTVSQPLAWPITTPTSGWQSALSVGAVGVGAPVESDAALRFRQSQSVTRPALSVISSLAAEIGALPTVQQYSVYENDTGSVDANGLPPHSITFVLIGGDPGAIASAIQLKKTPGTNTGGDSSELVLDPTGMPLNVNFQYATLVPVDMVVTLHQGPGYVSTIWNGMFNSITGYINGNSQGQNLSAITIGSGLYANSIISLIMNPADPRYRVVSVAISRDPASPAVGDLSPQIAWDELAVLNSLTVAYV